MKIIRNDQHRVLYEHRGASYHLIFSPGLIELYEGTAHNDNIVETPSGRVTALSIPTTEDYDLLWRRYRDDPLPLHMEILL